jgi:hypothetical protein
MAGHHDQESGLLAPAAQDVAQTVGDTLSDVLEAVRLTGALFFLVDASTPWVAEVPESSALAPVILPRVQHSNRSGRLQPGFSRPRGPSAVRLKADTTYH